MAKTIDTVFRKIEPKIEGVNAPEPKGQEASIGEIDSKVEVPFLDYESTKSHPYSVDYFQLGDNWDVFGEDVKVIETYLKGKIESGDIANSQKAVERELKMMEKMNNVKDDERAVVRVGVLKSYIKFLNDTKNIKRYANT
jgi:hypothetical protein